MSNWQRSRTRAENMMTELRFGPGRLVKIIRDVDSDTPDHWIGKHGILIRRTGALLATVKCWRVQLVDRETLQPLDTREDRLLHIEVYESEMVPLPSQQNHGNDD